MYVISMDHHVTLWGYVRGVLIVWVLGGLWVMVGCQCGVGLVQIVWDLGGLWVRVVVILGWVWSCCSFIWSGLLFLPWDVCFLLAG